MIRLLLFVIVLLGLTSPLQAIDQSGWNARKQSIELPSGVRLSYVEMGDPKGPPLLLLHGWTDSSRSWTILAPHLIKHRLLILDQRGHGASDKPDCCYAPSNFAHDARLFLDAMGIERAAVAGHSLGSMVAQILAAEHPDRVSKLVLIGSTALAPIRRGDPLWSEVAGLREPIDPGSPFMRDWHPANSPTPIDPAFAAAAASEIYATPLHVWHSVMREVADVPAGRLSSDIGAPTLILSGGKDSLFRPEHHAALAKKIPHATARVFPELGHNLLWEKPHEVAPAMTAFLDAPEKPKD